MKCKLCGKDISGIGNSGQPLVDGKVCNSCNWLVVRERLRKASKVEETPKNNPATESETSLGEISSSTEEVQAVIDPIKDFEEHAKKFEETFILGETPVRKEEPKNGTKIKGGEIEGEISSMDKPEKAEQVTPLKPEVISSMEGIDDSSLMAIEKYVIDIEDLLQGLLNRVSEGKADYKSSLSLLRQIFDLLGS